MGFDISDDSQGDDHALLLVSTGDDRGAAPELVSIDAGSNAFAWRIAGIIFGAALVGIIYLFTATLFSRRRIAVLAALFVAFDGMSYVDEPDRHERHLRGDLHRGRLRALLADLVGPMGAQRLVGAAAGRDHDRAGRGHQVGRLVRADRAVGAGPGPIALRPLPAGGRDRVPHRRRRVRRAVALPGGLHPGAGAWPCCWSGGRPIRSRRRTSRALPPIGVVGGGIGLAFAIAYSMVEGREPRSAVEFIFAFLARGAQAAWPAWIMLAVAGLLLLARAWRSCAGSGQRSALVHARRDGRLRLAVGRRLPAGAAAARLLHRLHPVPASSGTGSRPRTSGPGYGWSLDEMQSQMFGYHFGLQAGHPAASPWWSWPLDLKPVWFYSHSYDDRLMAVIYNGGNPILFWAGIPAVVWCAVLAWRRRSLALGWWRPPSRSSTCRGRGSSGPPSTTTTSPRSCSR